VHSTHSGWSIAVRLESSASSLAASAPGGAGVEGAGDAGWWLVGGSVTVDRRELAAAGESGRDVEVEDTLRCALRGDGSSGRKTYDSEMAPGFAAAHAAAAGRLAGGKAASLACPDSAGAGGLEGSCAASSAYWLCEREETLASRRSGW